MEKSPAKGKRESRDKHGPPANLEQVVTATKERVNKTHRTIAQSRELLGRAKKALESSKALRMVRPAKKS